jgi:hypothetical protein
LETWLSSGHAWTRRLCGRDLAAMGLNLTITGPQPGHSRDVGARRAIRAGAQVGRYTYGLSADLLSLRALKKFS